MFMLFMLLGKGLTGLLETMGGKKKTHSSV